MDGMEWTSKLPLDLNHAIRNLPLPLMRDLEEVHLNEGKPVLILCGNKEYELFPNKNRILKREELDQIFSRLSEFSAYACQEELSQGFLTISGGHRVGICGTAVMEANRIKRLKHISSMNIRICKEYKGCANSLIPYLIDKNGFFQNTIFVSPPKCGKTTLLRDLIRILSNYGFRMGVVDERSELSGMQNGISSFDLGKRTDILNRCPKAEGIRLLVRTMAPDIIATDEIGKTEDIEAVQTALCAGVGLLTTIHGNDREDLLRSAISPFISPGGFSRILYLTHFPSAGTIRCITNETGIPIWKNDFISAATSEFTVNTGKKREKEA